MGQKEIVIQRLEKLHQNLDVGMTKEKYLEVCKQLNTEPSEDKCPPSWEDFPEIVIDALNTFNQLGDRVYPEIGYIGKDYTNLNLFIELYKIEDKEFFIQLLSWLDSRAIKKSSEHLKREYDKLKRTSSGKK
jgi:hypothetical protein